MGLLRRLKSGLGGGGQGKGGGGGAGAHLLQFAKSRQGVEAFIEPKTAVTEMTVVLVAADGEWT
ncbi:MAG: oxidoreductase, partial [Geodermatophilaceae bacterium]|nr:oxidoreductase [Geodermatophilaceae bacterium]